MQIDCSQPKSDMEKIFLPILPKHIWEHVSPQAAATSYAEMPIVGSGPFYTVAFKKGAYIEMVRNPYYWGTKPAMDKIYFEMYQDPDTMVNDLEKGAIDARLGDPRGASSSPALVSRPASTPSPTTSTTGTTSTSTATPSRARWATPCCATCASATP